MKAIILGSGTSTGVPRIGGEHGLDWGDCDPEEPRNRRTRASILIENDAGTRLLVDTSTDLRQQFIANNIHKIDAVFWTHDHADHAHGIDDLRPLRYGRTGPIPGYGVDETVRRLRQRFGYVFAGQFGYHTIVQLETLNQLRMCNGIGIGWTVMPHGPAKSTGFRFDCDGTTISYATDFSEVTDEMVSLFYGSDVLITDCLRREAHPTHANVDMALDLATRTKAKKVALIHLDKSMDYATLSREIPANVEVGFDGMVIEP